MKLYTSAIFASLLLLSCQKSFLEVIPIGSVNETTLATKQGVDGLLVGAYSLLDGFGTGGGDIYGSRMVHATIPSDDAHTGTIPNGILAQMEGYTFDATSYPFDNRWRMLYSAVQRANDALRVLSQAKDLTVAEVNQAEAEARFLRGFYHMEAAMMWKNVPYLDETITYNNKNYNVSNTEPVWPKIEDDFNFAAGNLSATNSQVGRVNSWAAKAFLAKAYMFQRKFTEAKPLLKDIIDNGRTTNGLKYALNAKYYDNFYSGAKHGPEAVFAVQMSVLDGTTNGANGNYTDGYGGPFNSPTTGGFGWLQPSFDLANAYQTDPVTGLPLIGTYQNTPIVTDQGLASSDPFTPHSGTLDARLDWCIGRRGIPYLDWGYHPGQAWVRQQFSGGPYTGIKHIATKARAATDRQNIATNNPYNLIRFADVLLWAAEVEVEIGSLDLAEEYVNMVRARAANPDGFVKKYIDDDPAKGFSNIPAANYFVGLYTGQFAAQGKDFAREAVRFERRLELALEHHRLFDLRRYDNGSGYMATIMNNYLTFEKNVPGYDNAYMSDGHFTQGKNEIYPIPQIQIDRSMSGGAATLKQNDKY